MKTGLLITLSLFIIIISSRITYSQEDYSPGTTKMKNEFHGLLGYALLGGTISGGYSRIISENNSKFFTSYRIGIDLGALAFWEDRYLFTTIEFSALTGSHNSHFELSVGLASLMDTYYFGYQSEEYPMNDWVSYTPSGSIGYRFQKPERKSFFRTGIGFPYFLYAGLGTRF